MVGIKKSNAVPQPLAGDVLREYKPLSEHMAWLPSVQDLQYRVKLLTEQTDTA